MLLNHQFTVDLPIGEAWKVFTDIGRIAASFPGAELTEVAGDAYHGHVRVKVGPIGAQYAGTARFQERDADNHRAVIAATGRDSKGQGTAAATVTAQLTDEGDRTAVDIETDLAVTGKVAQYGRGALDDVSHQLLDVFLERLEHSLTNPSFTAVPGADGSGGTTPAQPTAEEQLNLNHVIFLPMLKKAWPTVFAAALTAVVVHLVNKRSHRCGTL